MNAERASSNSRMLRWLDLALKYSTQIQSPDERAHVLLRLAEHYADSSRPDQSEQSITALQEVIDASDNLQFKAETLKDLAWIYVRRGDRQRARQYAAAAVSEMSGLENGFWKELIADPVSSVSGAAGDYELAEKCARRRDAMDEIQLLLSRCHWYIANTDASFAESAIAQAEAAIDGFGVTDVQQQSKRNRLLDRLLGIYLESNKIDRAESLATQFGFDSLQAHYLAKRQWELGRHRQYQATISRLLSAIVNQKVICENYHGPMQQLEMIADLQHDIGDNAGFAVTLKAAERLASETGASPAWIRTAVFARLAAMQHYGGDEDGSNRSIQVAQAAAEEQTLEPGRDRSIVSTVWLSVSNGEIARGRFSDALQSAKRIPKRDSRTRQLAKVLVSAARDCEAESLIEEEKDPEAAADLCMWVVTHLNLMG
jgi:hypothetical protein